MEHKIELRADALVLLMRIPEEYFCVFVCPLVYSFRLSPMISPPTRTLTLFFPSNTSCLWLMVRMGLWVDVTSVFSLTAVQEEGGGFSHLKERKTEDEKKEERRTALSVHKCRCSDVTRHRCVAQLWPERGRPETSYQRSLGNSFFTLVILWNFFSGISFLSVCVRFICIRIWWHLLKCSLISSVWGLDVFPFLPVNHPGHASRSSNLSSTLHTNF